MDIVYLQCDFCPLVAREVGEIFIWPSYESQNRGLKLPEPTWMSATGLLKAVGIYYAGILKWLSFCRGQHSRYESLRGHLFWITRKV